MPSLGHVASEYVLITSLLLSQGKSFPSLQIWTGFLHSLTRHLQKLVLAVVESSTRSQPLGGGFVWVTYGALGVPMSQLRNHRRGVTSGFLEASQ